MPSKITTIDRSTAQQLSKEVEEALSAIAARHGLTLSMGGGKFSPATYMPKVTFGCVAESGVPAEFTRLCRLYGLASTDYGRVFRRNNGDLARITGIHIRRRRFPIGVEINGKPMLLTQEEVTRLLAAQPNGVAVGS
jgi:hypothetical protein